MRVFSDCILSYFRSFWLIWAFFWFILNKKNLLNKTRIKRVGPHAPECLLKIALPLFSLANHFSKICILRVNYFFKWRVLYSLQLGLDCIQIKHIILLSLLSVLTHCAEAQWVTSTVSTAMFSLSMWLKESAAPDKKYSRKDVRGGFWSRRRRRLLQRWVFCAPMEKKWQEQGCWAGIAPQHMFRWQ